MPKHEIVLSGINLFEGGPLSVYKDFLKAILKTNITIDYHLVLFVHKRELFDEYEKSAEIIELPKSRKSYAFRLFYEYLYFKSFSKKRKIDYWISLHDITPNVKAEHLYTYCHQPAPFYNPGKLDWQFGKRVCLFSILYKYLYGINIHRNDAVIVQQDWIRREFKKRYKLKNVIVAKPDIKMELIHSSNKNSNAHEYTFIYAAFPRSFKNFEVICEACKTLKLSQLKFKVILTLDGTENAYSKYLRDKYGKVNNIEWIGLRPRNEIFELYNESDCMIFPSKLETWGLPITEFKQTNKPIILADLPYAHETVGDYSKTRFFDNNDPKALAECMGHIIAGHYKEHFMVPIYEPYAQSWDKLCEMLFKEQK